MSDQNALRIIFNRCKSFSAALTPVLFCLLLASCGYQWQKPLIIDKKLQPVYVSESSALGIEIKRQLMRHGISVSKNPGTAKSVLSVIDNRIDSRSLSIASDGRTAEHVLRAHATLLWQDKSNNQLLNAPLYDNTLRVAKPDTPLARSAEEQQINATLTNALAKQAIDMIRHHLSTNE